MKEADVTVNGKPLNLAQSMTLRVGLSSYLMYLQEHGLGEDPTGRSICEGYKKCCTEILEMMR